MTYERFDASRSPSMAHAARRMRSWADTYRAGSDDKRGWVLSSPGPGCGKTHLAVATALLLLGRGISAYYITMSSWRNEMYKEFQSQDRSAIGEAMKKATCADVLVMDDLGAEKIAADEGGDWTRQCMMDLFDAREQAGRPVIVTTNLEPPELVAHIGGGIAGERIVSRLAALAHWLRVDGPDGRPEGAPI